MAYTIEIVNFRLKEGVDDEAFQAENHRMEQSFIKHRHGFVHRDTAKDDNGEYAIVLYWEKASDAQGSMDAFVDAPDTQDFTAMIDMDTFVMTRYEQVGSFD